MPSEKPSQILFYLTSLTFAVLTIPLQFGIEWIAMGWLVEGVLLIVYGYKYKLKYFELSGWIIYGLCLWAFFIVDVTGISKSNFDFKYATIIVSMVGVLVMYLLQFSENVVDKYTSRGYLIKAFKYFVILNIWGYLIYGSNKIYDILIDNPNYSYSSFFRTILFVFVTTILGFAISKIDLIKDKVVEFFTIFLYVLVDFICIVMNMSMHISYADKNIRYIALGILIIYNILVLFSIRDLIIKFIKSTRKSLEIYPLFMAIYLLGTITSLLIVHFDLGDVNLLFSILFMLLAFAYIAYGFSKKYYMIRWFGLALSFFATAKLFLYDLSYLRSVARIIAYFCFGAVLLAISFVYQKLKNNLDSIKNSIESR
jgi:hypothetical protein